MKNKIKYIIIILLTIILIIFSIKLIQEKQIEKKNIIEGNISEETIQQEVLTEVTTGDKEEYVAHNEDGKRINTSSKIQETQELEGSNGLEIEKIEITAQGNFTYVRGVIKNTSSETQGAYLATLSFFDKDERNILDLGVYVNEVEAGKTTTLDTMAGIDLANAYSYTIKKN